MPAERSVDAWVSPAAAIAAIAKSARGTAVACSRSSGLSRLFRDLGSRQPELDSRTIMAVMAGLEIDNVYRPLGPVDKRRIRATLRHAFRALIAMHGTD